MGIMDKAKELLNQEGTTDQILDKAEQLAKEKLGEDKAEHIAKAREEADKRLGTE
ncbi:antitoxin [Corynebacterium sp. 153RC1]|uniref:antitoxin n=1 Tax=unclassified Corynebacterium TaxID=2624378 RepID=UPI00211CE611|nr:MULTISPECIES: antitoxin [unclassified Corynebacterium]MCQ9370089.1 antitoxin [Corynebacterium sp. 35RC1]MCQ9351863.1 antitoxin [Corynebacterium sp. 209RC1]MCQ9355020.1 antitoxin [Corynebacterium sp. 1222RC1]MCQ9356145.1 antitoxin [Corynebacterium sp. 122RC1]MCQ9359540.1 antitoxin [Corynebacterium sp. 142RC1]